MRKDLIIIVNLENGKAQLEFKLPEEFLTERRETEMRMEIWGDSRRRSPYFLWKLSECGSGSDDRVIIAAAPVEWEEGSLSLSGESLAAVPNRDR